MVHVNLILPCIQSVCGVRTQKACIQKRICTYLNTYDYICRIHIHIYMHLWHMYAATFLAAFVCTTDHPKPRCCSAVLAATSICVQQTRVALVAINVYLFLVIFDLIHPHSHLIYIYSLDGLDLTFHSGPWFFHGDANKDFKHLKAIGRCEASWPYKNHHLGIIGIWGIKYLGWLPDIYIDWS